MKFALKFPILFISAMATLAVAQDQPASESRRDFRYAFTAMNDATLYGNLRVPTPKCFNQILLEPSFTLRYKPRWSLASSVVALSATHGSTHTQLRVKETYAGLSAGSFDFMVGRKIVRWGTGYAFSPAGVLDPPRNPANPNDRLNLNQGRDMLKVDYVHGPHALAAAWSTAALAPAGSNLHDTTAFRYNILARGFDTSLIAGNDRDRDAFGGLTFTRVLGQAWEVHGEALWRERGALVAGAKYIHASGVTFIGEFYTPPNTPYYRSTAISPLSGRRHYVFLNAGKLRLRELPGWKEWNVSGALVANSDDRSYISVVDAGRWFGTHVSSYMHLEIPAGNKTLEFGATPYSTATSVGIKFQL